MGSPVSLVNLIGGSDKEQKQRNKNKKTKIRRQKLVDNITATQRVVKSSEKSIKFFVFLDCTV